MRTAPRGILALSVRGTATKEGAPLTHPQSASRRPYFALISNSSTLHNREPLKTPYHLPLLHSQLSLSHFENIDYNLDTPCCSPKR